MQKIADVIEVLRAEAMASDQRMDTVCEQLLAAEAACKSWQKEVREVREQVASSAASTSE